MEVAQEGDEEMLKTKVGDEEDPRSFLEFRDPIGESSDEI